MGFVLQVIWLLKILCAIFVLLGVTQISSGFSVPIFPNPSLLIPPIEARGPSSVIEPGLSPNGSTLQPPVVSPPTKSLPRLPPSLSPADLTAPPEHALAASSPAQPLHDLAPPPFAEPPNDSPGQAAEPPLEKPYVSTPSPVTGPLHDSTLPPFTEPPLVWSHSPVAEPPVATPHTSAKPLHESPAPGQLVAPHASPPLSVVPSHGFFPPLPADLAPFLASSPRVPKRPHTSAHPLAAKPPESLSPLPVGESHQTLNGPPPIEPRPFLPSQPPTVPLGPSLSVVPSHGFFPPPSMSPLPADPPPVLAPSPRVAKRLHSSALPLAAKPPESLSPPPVAEPPETSNGPPPIELRPVLPSQPLAMPPSPPHAFDIHSPPIPPDPSSLPPQQVPSPHTLIRPPLMAPPAQEPPPSFVASPAPVAESPHASAMQSPPIPPIPPLESSPLPQIFPPPTSPTATPIPSPLRKPSPPLFAPPPIELPRPIVPPPSSTMPGAVSPQSFSPPPLLTSPVASPPLVMPSPASVVPPAMVPVHALSASPPTSPVMQGNVSATPPPTSQRKETQKGSPLLPASPEPSPSSRTSGDVPPIHHVMPRSYPPISHQIEAPKHSAAFIGSNASGLHAPSLATPTPHSNPISSEVPLVAPPSPVRLSPSHGSSPVTSPSKPDRKRQNGTAPAPFSSLLHPPRSVGSHYSPRQSPTKGTAPAPFSSLVHPPRSVGSHYSPHQSPTKGLNPFIAPSSHKPSLPPVLSPGSTASEGSHSNTFSPSASIHKRLHPRDEVKSPAPSSDLVPPPAPSQQAVSPYPANAPKSLSAGRQKYHPSAPPSQGFAVVPSLSPSESSEISPAPSPVVRGPGGHSEIPFPSPKISPSGSSTRNTKRPLAYPIQALPPPPPNQDCTSFTCPEPFTNTLPGSPCGCVWPMQVALRLSVALYTFFPLVSELAREIAAGVFMKQSQVRIMGANAANESPEKTIVIVDLVPLGAKFDNFTVFLAAHRFWHKQVAIDKIRFGDYDVLYVRYPGLPPSPPLAPGDNDVINGMPYSVGDPNGSKVHPLGVDVPQQSHKPRLNGSLIAVIVFSATLGVLICCAAVWVLILRCKNHNSLTAQTPRALASLGRSSGPTGHSSGSGPSSSLSFGSSLAPYTGSAKTFSVTEIERATDNFNSSRIIGEGGFGRVYSGVLEDETSVAVKVLKRDDQQGAREFLAEVEMLSRLHHRNLVKLIGICIDERMRCLVYELIPNGSVESHLHGTDKEIAPLDWASRMTIALGAARGLAYLHEDSSPRVIHRDFKSSNILLENDFTPKVSDFGLARTAMDEENRHISTRVMGTFGYVAPEYAMTGHLLVKSDVYSYGVVLLELLTGRKPVDMSQPPGQENLVAWTRPLLTSKEGLESIIDLSLGSDLPFESVAKVAAIASMCVQPEVTHRPFMGEVVQALKLVCNECDDSKEGNSRRLSHENLLLDLDETKVGPRTGDTPDPLQTRLSLQEYLPRNDIEKGLSVSEVFSLSTRLGGQETGSFRRHSASGPIRTTRGPWFWQRIKRLSQGSMSEHRIMYRWAGSH